MRRRWRWIPRRGYKMERSALLGAASLTCEDRNWTCHDIGGDDIPQHWWKRMTRGKAHRIRLCYVAMFKGPGSSDLLYILMKAMGVAGGKSVAIWLE